MGINLLSNMCWFSRSVAVPCGSFNLMPPIGLIVTVGCALVSGLRGHAQMSVQRVSPLPLAVGSILSLSLDSFFELICM